MKTLSLTLLIALIYSFGFAQNRKQIDSLKHEIAITKEDTNQVRLLNLLARLYVFNSADTAIIYYVQSLTLAEKLKDKIGIAQVQTGFCNVLTRMGNYPLALEYGLKSLSGFEKLKDTLGIVNSNQIICQCFREQGDYENSLKYVLNALKLTKSFWSNANRIKSPLAKRRVSNIEGILSSVYEKANQLDSAIKYGEKAYEMHKDWSGILYVLGNAYSKKGQYNKAMHYFKLGLPAAIKANFQKDKLEILTGISDVFKQKGALDSATVYSKKVLSDKFSKNFPLSLLLASTQLANIYESQNKTDSAFKYLKQSIALKDTLFNKGKTIAMQNLIFKEDQKKKELEEAELKFQNRLKIYGLIGGLTVLLLLSFLLWRRNLYKQKAYNLLQSQKRETDSQKVKVEQTLEILKATQNQLIQSEKLASLGELTAGIAHEIQNPLNFVNNFSELSVDLANELKEEIKNSPLTPDGGIIIKDKEYFEEIISDLTQNQEKINLHGKRASSIVTGMLEHSRARTGERVLTDINKLADESLRLSYHGLRAKDKNSATDRFNSDFELIADPNLPKINVISQDIGRVLINLINNAFYAVSNHVHVETLHATSKATPSLQPQYKPKVIVSTKQIDNQIIIKVKDNGTGMTEATKAKIFQPFFTTKPTGQGTGLGLSLAYDIITKGHGGTIECESMEGVGTTFIVKIPI